MNESYRHEVPLRVLHDSFNVFAATTWRGDDAVPDNPYSGFSLCHYTGDVPRHYRECREALAARCGVAPSHLVVPRQTHGSKVLCIKSVDYPTGFTGIDDTLLEGVDALVTDMKHVVIGVNTADCVPVVMCDDAAGVIAAVHAGWRGVVNGVVIKAVACMLDLGAAQSRIKAIFAPCILVNDFEVGEEVAGQFPDECVSRKYGERPHVDLPQALASQLRRAGITDMVLPAESTMSLPHRYFSARALGIASGRNFTFAMLRQ